ncbi:MAG: CaiB/BaiF CoA transferase family protein [Cryomorphaceae bacterium]|nr:CoA transferase [Flavobacteriales bacterium]
MTRFFEGTKVIELASVLAGPSVGMFFSELGATVVKIENKITGGDVTRNWRTTKEASEGPSAYYSAINFKKEILFLDLTTEDGKQKIREIVQDADIVLSNYSRRVAEKLGVTYEALSANNGALIFLQLDGFETQNKQAYDVVLQAETGWISMTGSTGNPAKLPVALIDVIAGHQLKEAALLALLKRERTGKGSFVSCNLERASLSALANQATNYLMNGEVAKPIGTLHPNIAPYGDAFNTSDSKTLVLAVGSEAHFSRLLESLNLDMRPEFETNSKRLANRTDLQAYLSQPIAKLRAEELESILSKNEIPFGFVRDLKEVLESRAAQDMILEETTEGRETKRLSGNAFNSDFLNF